MELGTAVGIASFGIQICQGLLWYYDAWKGYDSDISNAYDSITDLSKTLMLLISTLQRVNIDKERAERVKECLQSCVDALRKLEAERHSLQEHSTPEGRREKVRSALQRSRYPFKKETLSKLKDSVADVRERLKLALQVLQLDTNTASQDLLLQLSAQQQTEEYKKIVAWLCAADPWTNHDSARQRHEKLTGNWLLQCEQYQKWKLGKGGRVWMSGKAGCGKTVLCSTVIEDIRHHCRQSTDTACAFFYFTFSDEHKQSDRDLIRSLVAQLGWREPVLSMLRQAYERPNRIVPGPDELEKILLASIRSYSTLFLFLDALDECAEEHDVREGVLDRIETLTSHAPNLNIFATSRELPQIRESMDAFGFESLRIATPAVDADIQAYVSTQLSRDRHFRKFGPATLGLIEATIAGKADGMFRWAYCQLQELKKLKSTAPKYVKLALEALPTTLDETYTRMLLGIESMYHQQALTLLQWLAYARSPPTLGELVEAAIIDPIEESSIDTDNRGDFEDTLNILSGLVATQEKQVPDEQSDSEIESSVYDVSSIASGHTDVTHHRQSLSSKTRVRLAHFSVKEYLESKRMLESDANHFYLEMPVGHRALGQSCLTYLRHYSVSGEKASDESDLETFPLLQYAATSWFHHCALQQGGGEASRELSFLQQDHARHYWRLVHEPDQDWKTPFGYRSEPLPSAIYYASLLGLRIVVQLLLENGVDVNAQGGHYSNALQAASVKGDKEVVQLLLDKGADVNAQGGEYGNALQAASLRGDKEVVQLLLDKGADVNAQGGRYGNALQAASVRGHKEVVQLLLDKDADVNAQGGEYSNALQAASVEGDKEVVQLLLDKGADVNAQGGEYGNALQAASLRGDKEVVQLLLDKGADVNAQGGRYGNALQAASVGGDKEVVQLLLDKDADVNAQGGYYSNALQAASVRGHKEVVQLLQAAGAQYPSVDNDC